MHSARFVLLVATALGLIGDISAADAPAGAALRSAQSALTLGLGYTGGIDDVAVFNRSLTADEVRKIHGLRDGIKSLTGK